MCRQDTRAHKTKIIKKEARKGGKTMALEAHYMANIVSCRLTQIILFTLYNSFFGFLKTEVWIWLSLYY